MNYVENLLSRNGRIGSRFIWTGFEKRERYSQFKKWLHRKDIKKRESLATAIKEDSAWTIPADKGFLPVPNPGLAEVPNMIQQAETLLENDPNFNLRENNKPQLITGLLKKDQLDLNSPFVKFALHEQVWGTVARYLNVVPILSQIDLWYSRTTEGLSNSQFFHLDWDAQTQVKVFVYISEVKPESGPLHFVPAGASAKMRAQLNYQYGEGVPDEQAFGVISENDLHSVTGPQGSIVFGDTSKCFHFGSRVKGENQSRTVAMFQFLKPEAFQLPINYRKWGSFAHLATAELSPEQRLILGAK